MYRVLNVNYILRMHKRGPKDGIAKSRNYFKKHRFGNGKGSRYITPLQQNFLPIFEKSGLLALESHNKQGICFQHVEPQDSISPFEYFKKRHIPMDKRVRFEALLYKKSKSGSDERNDGPVKKWELSSNSSYIIGRDIGYSLLKEKNEQDRANNNDQVLDQKEIVVAEIGIPEEIVSKQHAVIQFREKDGCLVSYIMDLDSSKGTLLNGIVLLPARYIQIWSGDILEFSENTNETEYELVFMAE